MILLVRHGQTEYNRDGRGLGRADVPLTEAGLAQARAVAARLASANVRRVISSPLARALTVAQFVAAEHRLEPEPLDGLTELDVGETEGLAFAEIRQRFPDFLAQWGSDAGWQARMPGGESIEDLSLRSRPIAEELMAGGPPGDLVVVSHNFTLRVLICHFLGLEPSKFRSFEIGLAAVTTLSVRGGRVAVHSMNDTCHLSHLNLA